MDKSVTKYEFINQLKSLPFVEQIWLFGSRARDDYHERSDIDLAIICSDQNDKNWSKVLEIIDEADSLLEIDCIQFNEASLTPAFYQNILKDKKVIYMKEIPWKDRFDSLGRAISKLEKGLQHPSFEKDDLIREGIIKRFEFTIELFWKTLKKILQHEEVETNSPKDTLKKAYQYKLIDPEDAWLNMLSDRNKTSHIYDEQEANKIIEHIKAYTPIFRENYAKIKKQYGL